jgi:adenosylcobinamide-GDP ribazoletransferase
VTTPTGRSWIARDIVLCLAFLTRLPVPAARSGDRLLGQAIWAAPLAGTVVALVGGAAYALAFLTGAPGGIAAGLALAAMLLVTGCLHEDGLADVADGFGGGATGERKLEIMRDSRIGTFGTVALLLALLIRWSALAELHSPAHVFGGLIAGETASRALLPAFMRNLPPARPDGLAAAAGPVSPEAAAGAAAIGLAALLLFLGPGSLPAAILVLAIAFFAFRYLCLAQIGGQTGDTLGALQQIGVIIVLTIATVVLR